MNSYLNHAAKLAHHVIQSVQVDGQLADRWNGDYRRSFLLHEQKQPFQHRASIRLITHLSKLVQHVAVKCFLYSCATRRDATQQVYCKLIPQTTWVRHGYKLSKFAYKLWRRRLYGLGFKPPMRVNSFQNKN